MSSTQDIGLTRKARIVNPRQRGNYKLYVWIVLLTIFSCSCNNENIDNPIDSTTKQKIKLTFDNWAKEQIEKGIYFAKDSCNCEYYKMKDSLGLEAVFGYAIPWDSSEIHIYYAILNADSIIDALITFPIYQCDGGNATMWHQEQILVLSQGSDYVVIDNYFHKFGTNLTGFFHLDSAATKTVFGTYYEFTDNDGRCCPSIQKPIKIDLKKNEFKYIDK